MKELSRTTRLIIAVIIILLVLIIGYTTMKKPVVVFKLSPTQTLSALKQDAGLVSPEMLKDLKKNINNDLILIDIRNPDEFNKGHLDKAINIPVRNLLDEKYIKIFRKLSRAQKKVILYGRNQLEASGPGLLLRQLGINNVNVLQGGYQYMNSANVNSPAVGQMPQWMAEVPRFDAAMLKRSSASSNVSLSKSNTANIRPESIKPVKKPGSSGGGC